MEPGGVIARESGCEELGERFTQARKRAMEARQVMTDHLQVVIATPFGEGQRGGIDRLMDLMIATLRQRPELQLQTRRLVTRGPGSLAGAPFTFARALAELYRAKRRGEIDVLHINLAAGGSACRKAVLGRAARSLGIPYVVHLHGSRFHQFWPTASDYWARAVDRFFIESAEIIVLGRFWENLIVSRLPGVKSKITILANATAPAAPAVSGCEAADGRVHISFLGELGARKGTPQLVEALSLLATRQDWRATIAGNGDVEQTRMRAGERGIAGRLDIPGWLDAAGVNRVLGTTDIFVLPSFAENLPMAILEAFARGIAVVATPVGAVPEVVDHGRNGLIVKTGDAGELAAALELLISDGELRRRLGATARQDHARRFEIGGYLTEMATIWRRAAAAKAGPAAAA
jgi:glycosyltransferase involved in cell wall biosynthesis